VAQTQTRNVFTSDTSVLTRRQPQQDRTQSRYASSDAPAPVVYVTTIILFHNGTLAVFEAHSMLCSRSQIGKVSILDAIIWTCRGPRHGYMQPLGHVLFWFNSPEWPSNAKIVDRWMHSLLLHGCIDYILNATHSSIPFLHCTNYRRRRKWRADHHPGQLITTAGEWCTHPGNVRHLILKWAQIHLLNARLPQSYIPLPFS